MVPYYGFQKHLDFEIKSTTQVFFACLIIYLPLAICSVLNKPICVKEYPVTQTDH